VNDMTLTHATGCSKPPPDSRLVKPGWLRLKCPECAHVGSVAAIAPTLAPAPRPNTVAAAYVCRDHHEQPVNFRGKGCPRCPTRKANKRTASEPSDYTEMEK